MISVRNVSPADPSPPSDSPVLVSLISQSSDLPSPPQSQVSPPRPNYPPSVSQPLSQFPKPSILSPPLSDPSDPDPEFFPDSLPLPDVPIEAYGEDENLSSVERIYLLSRSSNPLHRVFISRSLHSFLSDVAPLEAIEYVLPLLHTLAVDEEDMVKEALATELVPIMWWFFQNCRIVEDDSLDSQETPPLLPVQSFTPILGSLLIDHNTLVGGPARFAVVEVLNRLHNANDNGEDNQPFGIRERQILEQEIIYQVIIGMGRLDISEDTSSSPVFRAESTLTPQSPVPVAKSLAMTPISLLDLPPPLDPSCVSSELSLPKTPAIQRAIPDAPTSPTQELSLSPDLPACNNEPGMAILPVYLATSASEENGVKWSPQTPSPDASTATFGDSVLNDEFQNDDWLAPGGIEKKSQDVQDNEQAAIGRLSSMSLIATVTANAKLPEETIRVFAEEVAYIGSDPLFWVRREASFAVGALAKVVPLEVLSFSLLPLFETLANDDIWRVRHSAIFALPGILARLTPQHRRSLALKTVLTLAADSSLEVRSGVLEVLGEVIYTFHEDDRGAPTELVDLFVGRKSRTEESKHTIRPDLWQSDSIGPRVKKPPDSQLPTHSKEADWLTGCPSPMSESVTSLPAPEVGVADVFFCNPARNLITSFNYPAVALSLGPQRWHEIRDYYLALSRDPNLRVRRTIAAGLGEVARILGKNLVQRDLLEIWDDMIHDSADGVTRLKALGGVSQFIGSLEGQTRDDAVGQLVELWERWLTGWRERERLTKALPELALLVESQGVVIRALMIKSLMDNVAAVREAAITVLPDVLEALERQPYISEGLLYDLSSMVRADLCRRRTTYVACCVALLAAPNGELDCLPDGFWTHISQLSQDRIVDVRISVSRLVAVICDKFYPEAPSRPPHVLEIIRRLMQDPSHDVRDFVAFSLAPEVLRIPEPSTPHLSLATFSRPPSIVPARSDKVEETTVMASYAGHPSVCQSE